MSEIREKAKSCLDQVSTVIFGQKEMIEGIFAALVCEGHVLLEGMPGLGKTLSVMTLGQVMDLDFKRIQFTPDLLPSDLIGTMIYNQVKNEFTTKFGPIFTQILLADEINRSPAKVQSALLEAMGEKQVTIGEKTYQLTSPFVVLATQNPIDHEGTYPLPEAQMDRFMAKVSVNYPSFEDEKKIITLDKSEKKSLGNLFSVDDLHDLQEEVRKIYVDEKITTLIAKIIQGTRPGSDCFLKKYSTIISSGSGPRGGIWLYQLSKFEAYMDGSEFVAPEHLIKVMAKVLGHRVILTYEASIDNISASDLVLDIAKYYI